MSEIIVSFCCDIFKMLMMTSSNGEISRVTGHLCGEFTDYRWIFCSRASDAESWCFLWSLIFDLWWRHHVVAVGSLLLVQILPVMQRPFRRKRFQVMTSPGFNVLTHWGRVTYIWVSKLSHHWFRWWLGADQVTSHHLNQLLLIVNWNLQNKIQWNFNQNMMMFAQETAIQTVVCKMAAVLYRHRCVKKGQQYPRRTPKVNHSLISTETDKDHHIFNRKDLFQKFSSRPKGNI